MAKCDVCGREGVTFRTEFADPNAHTDVKIPTVNLCRTCRGKLILSLPKVRTPEAIIRAIDNLFENATISRRRR